VLRWLLLVNGEPTKNWGVLSATHHEKVNTYFQPRDIR